MFADHRALVQLVRAHAEPVGVDAELGESHHRVGLFAVELQEDEDDVASERAGVRAFDGGVVAVSPHDGHEQLRAVRPSSVEHRFAGARSGCHIVEAIIRIAT